MESATSIDIEDLVALLKNSDKKIKFRTLYMDAYTMLSVIQLIDLIMGSEPTDFAPERADTIQIMKETLSVYAAKHLQDRKKPDLSRVHEVLVQKTTKWDIRLKRHPRHDTVFSSNFAPESDPDE